MPTEPQNPWADDLIGRGEDAKFLQDFLVGRVSDRLARGMQGSYVLNIDAEWGAGKTFFLRRFGAQLEQEGYLVAFVDAWQDDHADDPFVAVLAAIDRAMLPVTRRSGRTRTLWKAVQKEAVPIVGRALAGAGKVLVRRYVGLEAGELLQGSGDGPAEAAAGAIVDTASAELSRVADRVTEKLIADFSEKNVAIQGFRERLSAAVTSAKSKPKAPLFVLVDELDRCRPSYAVALLERVKHLFEVNNVVFVFATNTDQLQHSVSGAYGPGFNGYRYLKRFFERTYRLHTPSLDRIVEAEAAVAVDRTRLRAPKQQPIEFLNLAVSAYKMDPREVKQFMDILGSVAAAWRSDTPIELVTLVPMAVNFLRSGTAEWEDVLPSIPKALSLVVGRRRHGDRDEVHFKVSSAFASLMRATANLAAAGTAGEMTAEQEYAYYSVMPEWNGKAISPNTPSVQRQLPRMIANAGRLLEE